MADAEPPHAINDIGFTEALLNRLSEKLCINEDRIYATGMGVGGGMTHLIACSQLSDRIAAFSVVNGNIFQGLLGDGDGQIKDPVALMWKKCEPKRKPIPLQIIHTENNTVFDYWGERKYGERMRRGAVMHLVEWATRNRCGSAAGYPTPWRSVDDYIHKTLLEQGYIFEGYIQDGAIAKASYHCWAGDVGRAQEEAMEWERKLDAGELNDEDDQQEEKKKKKKKETKEEEEEEEKEKEKKIDPRTEEEKLRDLLAVLRTNQVHEHFFIRGLGHGWPRIELIPSEEWKAWKEKRNSAKGARVSSQPPAPQWKAMTEAPSKPLNMDLNKNVTTFDYGFLDSHSDDRLPSFDATERVLSFFRLYRLSHQEYRAPRTIDGLTEVEVNMLDNIVDQIKGAMDGKKQEQLQQLLKEAEKGEVPVAAEVKEGGLSQQEENLDKEKPNTEPETADSKSSSDKQREEAPEKEHVRDEL
jgi:hypothetical protein